MRDKERAVLLENLAESTQFLISSASSFDRGYEAEAKRLAVTLRVLLHDTPQSHSLLDLLGVKDQIRFTNTAAEIEPDNVLPTLEDRAPGWPGCQPGAYGPWAIRGREADASSGSSSRPGFRRAAGRP
jgi:hypothetical protein